ncbi:MAG: hypothetical protein KDJ69_05895 [Nitratireductor sp.]|nr:hypothetical protein [Nitratireductor sp.]
MNQATRRISAGFVAALLIFAVYNPLSASERQFAFTEYTYTNENPAYEAQTGPRIVIHRYVSPYLQRGAYEPFAMLVETDGFQTQWLDGPLTAERLAETEILAIVNAYSRSGAGDYRRYSTIDVPSIYSEEELDLIVSWVKEGGSLLLLADHSPFAGGTIALASRFGAVYMTGHAVRNDSISENKYVNIDFRRTPEEPGHGTLNSHPITDGALGLGKIEHFYAFGGQAIIPPADAINILQIPQGFEAILTFRLNEEFYSAPRIDAGGLSQGMAMTFGEGRVAIFGEAGGFTTQRIDDNEPFGLADPDADENAAFVLATLRWLADYRPKK